MSFYHCKLNKFLSKYFHIPIPTVYCSRKILITLDHMSVLVNSRLNKNGHSLRSHQSGAHS